MIKYYLEYFWAKLTYNKQIAHDKGLHSKQLSKQIYLKQIKEKYND